MAKRKPVVFTTAFASYTTVRVLGEGGSGRVFEVRDDTGEAFALKLLDPAKGTTRAGLKRFRNEILFGWRTQHSGIVRILDDGVGPDDAPSSLFYVMPLYKQTLRGLMGGSIDPAEALRLFTTLLDGVEAAHLLGVVHRDLKPENVLLDDANSRLVVADFGVARFEQEALYTLVDTQPGTRLANFLYAAPEQKQRGQPVDLRADVFALGLILNEMFTGEVPLAPGYRLVGGVRQDFAYLDGLVAELIQQDPAERPATIADVKRAMIKRRVEFVTLQKIDKLTNTVVPASTVDDPLVVDPIKIVDFTVDAAGLVLELNREPNRDWTLLYRNMSQVTFIPGSDFRQAMINGKSMTLRARENLYQQLIDQSKVGIARTNAAYAQQAEEKVRQHEQEERARLRREADEERRRLDLLGKLRL